MGGGLKAAREGSQSALKIAGGALHTAGGPGGGSTPSAVMPQPRGPALLSLSYGREVPAHGTEGSTVRRSTDCSARVAFAENPQRAASTSAPRLAQTLCHPCPAADGPIVTAVLEASTPREEP